MIRRHRIVSGPQRTLAVHSLSHPHRCEGCGEIARECCDSVVWQPHQSRCAVYGLEAAILSERDPVERAA